MSCSVCNHPNRAEIENALLNIGSGNPEYTLSNIAAQYELPEQDLRVHALMHNPIGANIDSDKEKDSLVRRIKLKEADMLSSVANEYMVTLKNVGRKINKMVANEQDEAVLPRLLTKPVADLYLGLGGEIRSTVKTLAELDTELNGAANSGSRGLIGLVESLRKSNDRVG